MYYLLPLYLLLLYSATFLLPKAPPPVEVAAPAPQAKPAEKQQPAIGEERSPMTAPSEPAERKEAVKQETRPEQRQESDIAMAAPSEPVEKEIAEPAPQANPAEKQRPAIGESSPMTAPSEPAERKEAVKQETGPEQKQKQESDIAMAAPSEPIEKKEEVKEAPSEVTQETEPKQKKVEVKKITAKEKLAKLKEKFEFGDIHFKQGRYGVTGKDRNPLSKLADWLLKNKGIRVVIEGHSDERGTNDVNMAIGRIRANSVRKYIISRGINAKRVSVISYGEEAPLCLEPDEKCWRRNRRVSFDIKS